MEETEYALLRRLGLSVSMRDARGQFGFPRLRVEVNAAHPARLDERLEVEAGIGQLSARMIVYQFAIRSLDRPRELALVASGRFEVACCRFPRDAAPYAILIPDGFLGRLEQFAAGQITDHAVQGGN